MLDIQTVLENRDAYEAACIDNGLSNVLGDVLETYRKLSGVQIRLEQERAELETADANRREILEALIPRNVSEQAELEGRMQDLLARLPAP